jgi:hypothetical protein
MEARLPQNKVDRIISFIGTFLSRRSIRKRELLQLLGHFNFAARVIIPGRTFVTYLISLSTKVNNLNYYVSLSPECRGATVFFVDSGIFSFLKIMVRIAIVLSPDVSAV